jgi:hypothetical protein
MKIRKLFAITSLVAVMGNLGVVPVIASDSQTLKNLDFSITLPKSVRLVQSGCSSIPIKYEVGIRAADSVAGYATILISNSNNDIAGFEVLEWGLSGQASPTKGEVSLKYCREDWIASDGSAVAGVEPGALDLAFYSKWSDGVTLRDSSKSGFLIFTPPAASAVTLKLQEGIWKSGNLIFKFSKPKSASQVDSYEVSYEVSESPANSKSPKFSNERKYLKKVAANKTQFAINKADVRKIFTKGVNFVSFRIRAVGAGGGGDWSNGWFYSKKQVAAITK